MRIVLTHPFCWPYVRRGTERIMDAYARYLTRRGHEVTTLSSRPGAGVVECDDRGRRILHRQRWVPLMSKLRIEATHTFVPDCARSLLAVKPDVVHSYYFTDSLAALLTRPLRGHRC